MSKSTSLFLVLLGALALTLPACGGGGGGGLPSSGSAILVRSTSIPPADSGGLLNYPLDIQGGCGGPYDIQLVSGTLPPGVEIIDKDNYDDDRYEGLGFTANEHRLYGYPLADGNFNFRLQVTDTACTPFASIQASYALRVNVGEVVVVQALLDGNPSLVAPGGTSYNPDFPALPAVVYNDFNSIDFVVAGGVGPYTMKLYDDPSLDDGNLPLGVSIPPGTSTSIVGAPVEVGPDGGPFLLSFEISDSVGGTTIFTVYWKIDTPAIIVATESVANGQAGVQYSDQFTLAGGVPPFTFDFVETGLPEDYTSDVNPNPTDPNADVLYNPGGPPTVTPAEALNKIDASAYPAPNDLGPNYDTSNQGCPPEGMYLVEDTGSLTGIPRRRGTFSINLLIRSALVPNSFGQHAWGTFAFEITGAPPIEQDPSYTVDGVFSATPPYAQIVGADLGQAYNPDGGPPGLQALASGGVPQDGRTDAPHWSQTALDPSETEGAYQWTIDWDPDSEGNSAITAMEMTPSGVFKIEDGREDDLIPQFEQALGFTAIDFALPTQLASTQTEKVRFEIGPDKVLLTQSTTSFTANYDNRAQNDTNLTMKVMLSYSSGADVLRAPADSELAGNGTGKIGVPSEAGSGVTVADLLSGMDITRVSINPTGWWDDTYHLNPRAARPFQHGDRNAVYAYYGLGYHGTTYYLPSSYSSGQYQWQPTAVSVRLPKAPSVTADTANGVYNDGGKLFVFETDDHLGVFIIRKDGRVYIPAAFDKGDTGWVSFGDNWNEARKSPGQSNSATKIPQMTVSPDGRIAAMKLRSDTSYDKYETADESAILLISLTGERISAWGSEVYKVIDTGSNGSSTTGSYMFAPSLTLTNDHLYYLIGSGSSLYLHFKDHYIYRYDLFSGDDGGSMLHSNFNSEWTNAPGSAMQTPFQDWYNPFYDYNGPNPVTYGSSGTNIHESSYAPHPFRVNADGNACAILAALTTTQTTTGSEILKHHVWVDYEGDLHQLSSVRRRTSGGGRGISLFGGPMYYPTAWSWGAYDGPTSRFEISDDGTKVAIAYNRTPSPRGYGSYSNYHYVYRSDIAAYATSNAWASHTTHEITGDGTTSTSPSSAVFSTPTTWRFGALTFTADGEGLVFWGGYSNYSPTATYQSNYYMYYGAKSYVGSLYSYDFSDSSVRNILSSSNGGCNKTVGSAFTSTSFSTSSWQRDGGVIKPFGGFLSMNREFLYIATRGAITQSNARDGTLIGVNIRSLDTSQSINGHTDGRAFVVGGFASRNGFYDGSYPYHYYGLGYYYRYPGYYWYYCGNYGGTQRAASTDNGWVFFASTEAQTYSTTATSSTYGGAVNSTYYLYPYYAKRLYVFDPNVGGDVQQIVGTNWNGGGSYQVVGCVEAADDGHSVASIWSGSTYYQFNDNERLTVWSGIDLDASGDLVATPNREDLESADRYVSSHIAFSPSGQTLYYAAGTGNENAKTLKAGNVGDGSSSSYAFSNANYCVLHAGR